MYVIQVHFVHYNMKYDSFKEAVDKEDGLCASAVFFKVIFHLNFSSYNVTWKGFPVRCAA